MQWGRSIGSSVMGIACLFPDGARAGCTSPLLGENAVFDADRGLSAAADCGGLALGYFRGLPLGGTMGNLRCHAPDR